MAHLAKYAAGAAGGVLKHDERTEKDKVQSRKNESIDSSRTHLNYNLAPKRKYPSVEKTVEDYTSREEIHLLKRKNVNVMCSWVVTMPTQLRREEQDKFFRELYTFLENRYGHKGKDGVCRNILTAAVHLDETTPHMHFGFIPVAYDNKKSRYTISAKLVNDRFDLQSFHKDLSAHMVKVFGRDIGIENGATKQGNQTVEQLKEKTKLENEINQLQKYKSNLDNEVLASEMSLKALQSDLNQINDKIHNQEKILSELTREHELSLKTLENEIDVTPKKFAGGFKGLSPQQAQDLKFTAERAKKYKKQVKDLTAENTKLRSELEMEQKKANERQSILSREKMKQAQRLTDKDNQLSLLKDALGISHSADYDECHRQLVDKGLIRSSRNTGLHR